MVDFESDNFGSIINKDNLKDEDENLTFDDSIFDINETDNLDDEENEDDNNEEENDNNSDDGDDEDKDNKSVSFLNFDDDDDDKKSKKNNILERNDELEKLDTLTTKSNVNEFNELIVEIEENYKKIENNLGSIPSTLPNIKDIKTYKQAKEIYRLTNKKLNSFLIADSTKEIITYIADALPWIFNGKREFFGYKLNATGYGNKVRNRINNCDTEITKVSNKIAKISMLSTFIKFTHIFGISFVSTIKENSDRAKQGLDKQTFMENKKNKNLVQLNNNN